MRNPPYAITGEPVVPSWRDKHPYWKITVGGLVVVLFVAGGIVVGLLSGLATLRHSLVFQEAVVRAQANPEVISQLGEPIRIGRLLHGELRTRGQFGFAHFEVPLVGPRNKGSLYGSALEIRGEWQFRRLEVDGEGFPAIDLLPPAGAK